MGRVDALRDDPSPEAVRQVKEHYDAALDADPRNQGLHERLLQHLGSTASFVCTPEELQAAEADLHAAEASALAAEQEEMMRLQIQVTRCKHRTVQGRLIVV